ncbi:MAG: cation transporter [Bacteroidales bacterium]|nr:cation transporter [Bacteroidales bacterium]
MKKLAILIFAALIGFSAAAQSTKTTADSKNASKQTTTSTAPAKQATFSPTTIQKVVIQTNGVCSKCEALFKENVPFFKGVKDYTYDSKTSKMTITYDSKKTNPDLLRQQISKLGYNADNVKADPAARAKLPACCQVDKKPGQAAGCCGHDANKGGCSGQHSGCSGHSQGSCKENHSSCKDKYAGEKH